MICVGRARKTEPKKWRWIEFEALREARTEEVPGLIESDDPREFGDVLWGELWSRADLEEMRDADPEVFNALFQQRPKPAGGTLVKKSFFNERWSHIPGDQGALDTVMGFQRRRQDRSRVIRGGAAWLHPG